MTVVCLGLATLDSIFHVPHAPEPGGRVVAADLVLAGGGPAATAAVTLARLGVETAFVGAVGDDWVGNAVRDGLAEEGVDVSELAVVVGARSPRSSILVDERTAARTIVHYPGTVPLLQLSERAAELCRSADWVHVDHAGYAAAPRDARLSIDGGNPIPSLDLAGVALYAPTEGELQRAFGHPLAALDAGAELVVVTRGAHGSSVHSIASPSASTAFHASATTSGPAPSPGIRAIFKPRPPRPSGSPTAHRVRGTRGRRRCWRTTAPRAARHRGRAARSARRGRRRRRRAC